MADNLGDPTSEPKPEPPPGANLKSGVALAKGAKPLPLPLKPAGLVPSLNRPKPANAGMPTMKLPPPLPASKPVVANSASPGKNPSPLSPVARPVPMISGSASTPAPPKVPPVRRKISREEFFQEADTSAKANPQVTAEPVGWKALEPGDLDFSVLDLQSPAIFTPTDEATSADPSYEVLPTIDLKAKTAPSEPPLPALISKTPPPTKVAPPIEAAFESAPLLESKVAPLIKAPAPSAPLLLPSEAKPSPATPVFKAPAPQLPELKKLKAIQPTLAPKPASFSKPALAPAPPPSKSPESLVTRLQNISLRRLKVSPGLDLKEDSSKTALPQPQNKAPVLPPAPIQVVTPLSVEKPPLLAEAKITPVWQPPASQPAVLTISPPLPDKQPAAAWVPPPIPVEIVPPIPPLPALPENMAKADLLQPGPPSLPALRPPSEKVETKKAALPAILPPPLPTERDAKVEKNSGPLALPIPPPSLPKSPPLSELPQTETPTAPALPQFLDKAEGKKIAVPFPTILPPSQKAPSNPSVSRVEIKPLISPAPAAEVNNSPAVLPREIVKIKPAAPSTLPSSPVEEQRAVNHTPPQTSKPTLESKAPVAPASKEKKKIAKAEFPITLASTRVQDFKPLDRKPSPLFSRQGKTSLEQTTKADGAPPLEPTALAPNPKTEKTEVKLPLPLPVEEAESRSGARLIRTTLRRVSKTVGKKTTTPAVVPVKKIKAPPAALTREQRNRRWKIANICLFYALFAGILATLYYGAPYLFRETRLEGQVIPPDGMLLANEAWVVADFSEQAREAAVDLSMRHSPKLQEITSQQDRQARIQADATVKQDRLKALQDQKQAYKDQINRVVQDARKAAQLIWDGPGAQLDVEFDEHQEALRKVIADRAQALHLNYKPNPDYASADVWASAYRLALYEVPPGVDEAKEHAWLDTQITAWRSFTKSLDLRQKNLRDQVAQIQAAPTSKVEELTSQIDQLQHQIDVTSDELQPILKEKAECEASLAQLQSEDSTYDAEALQQLSSLPNENTVDKFRFPIDKNGRFSWRQIQSNFSGVEKLRRFWLFTRAVRKTDGREFWSLINITIYRDNCNLVIIRPGAYLDTRHILHPDQIPNE